jgi:GTP-binding protein
MAVQRHPPPAVNGKRIKPKYVAQTKARPPTFVLFATRADQLPESYRRYLINSLRESFDLPGVPLRITVKSGSNPFVAEEGARPWLSDQGRGGPKVSNRKTTVGGKSGSGTRPANPKAGAAKPAAADPAPAKAEAPRAGAPKLGAVKRGAVKGGVKASTKPGRVKVSPIGKPAGRWSGPKPGGKPGARSGGKPQGRGGPRR